MFIALYIDKATVTIDNAIQGVPYFCPICQSKVIIKAKQSEVVAAHFAHRKKMNAILFLMICLNGINNGKLFFQ